MARKRPLRVLVTVLFSLVCLFALLQGVDRLLYRAEDASMPVETALPSAMGLPPAVLTSSVPTAPAQEAQPLPEALQSAARQAPVPAALLAGLFAALWRNRARSGRDRNGNVLQRRSYMLSLHQAFSFSDGGA
ncbi:hypothetical protein [Beduinella massiliensis]|uniref:hypothetical protein n=1 Tax=Beduinella massiliensis TaxID=1852363 RepID=UPI000C818010